MEFTYLPILNDVDLMCSYKGQACKICYYLFIIFIIVFVINNLFSIKINLINRITFLKRMKTVHEIIFILSN